MNNIAQTLETQHRLQSSGRIDLAYRRKALISLREAIKNNEKAIAEALKADLNKCADESYLTETGMLLSSVSYALKHLMSWTRPRCKSAGLAIWPARARVIPEPYGSVLIMAPWNYPVLLALDPLIAAVAAGNCAVVKPSEMAPESAKVVAAIIRAAFVPEHVSCVCCEAEEIDALLDNRFDYIFFTGSPEKGRSVMAKAARHITPVTLELGGKSPFIVDESADLELAARRLAFGKLLNAGQTCVAPDYVLLHRSHKDSFPELFRKQVAAMLPPKDLPTYARIVNRRHFDRLAGYLGEGKILAGGNCNFETLQIEPTLLEVGEEGAKILQDEIFGPIAPVIYFDDIQEVISYVRAREKPLALYLFTKSDKNKKLVMERLSYGGGAVNDCIMHLVPQTLPFGGVGNSGIGSYHGKHGFDSFTHYKSVIEQPSRPDVPVRYRPYGAVKKMLVRLFLRG